MTALPLGICICESAARCILFCACCLPAGKVGAEVVEAACVIELPALQGRAKLGSTPLFVLIEKEGE